MTALTFTVYGRPEPKGSTRAFLTRPKPGSGKVARAVVTADNKKTLPWMQQVALTGREAMSAQGFDAWDRETRIAVRLVFYLARPASIPRRRFIPTVKPDVDKLVRGALDALTGVVFTDDAQVADLVVAKRYGQPERVEIMVRLVEAREAGAPVENLPLFEAVAASR